MRKKETREKKSAAGGKGLRWKSAATTLLCVLCIGAILFAPKLLLSVRDGQILDTFYAVELSENSLSNPELAANVGLTNAVALWVQRNKEYHDLEDEKREGVLEEIHESMKAMHALDLVPDLCMNVVNYLWPYGLAYISGATGTVSGYELEDYAVEFYQEDAYGYSTWYYSLSVTMYQGKIIRLDMWSEVSFAMMEELGITWEEWAAAAAEAEAEAALAYEEDGNYAASMLQPEERPEGEIYEDYNEAMYRRMENYIEYLGLDALEDWRIVNSGEEAQASSNYSMLGLVVYYYANENDHANISIWPSY